MVQPISGRDRIAQQEDRQETVEWALLMFVVVIVALEIYRFLDVEGAPREAEGIRGSSRARRQEQREPNYVGNLYTLTENSEMKQVLALVLGVALVGASAATTFAQTGTGGGTGGGTGTKSTTTTTSPTTAPTTTNTGTKSTTSTTTTSSPTTPPTTTKKATKNCPGNAGEHGHHKGLAHNPNC
jgi:hypothetical protein